MIVRGTIKINVSRCVKCKRCVLACAIEHSKSKTILEAFEEAMSGGEIKPRVEIGLLGELGVPMQCRHCENPQCVAICPTGALKRLGKEGPVVVTQKLCIGCKHCQIVCHFGVPQFADSGKIYKCDLCVERLDKDIFPACVEACPTGTLEFVTFSVNPQKTEDATAPEQAVM